MTNYTLTRMQRRAIDKALTQKTCVIRGIAGSGKTLVAVSIASELAKKKKNAELPVVIATASSALAELTKRKCKDGNIKVLTVQEILQHFDGKNKLAQHLIIDEAQDLDKETIKLLKKATKSKIVYIGDLAQSYIAKHSTWKSVAGKAIRPIDLKVNFRNTKQIFDVADSMMKFGYSANRQVTIDFSKCEAEINPNGTPPQVFYCKNLASAKANMMLKVNDILAEGKPNETICVACRHESLKAVLAEELKDLPNATTLTFPEMKGLEFDHVLLFGLDEGDFFTEETMFDVDAERRLIFVAMTRARATLSLFCHSNDPLHFINEIHPNKVLPMVWNYVAYQNAYKEQLAKIAENEMIVKAKLEEGNQIIAQLEQEIERLSKEKNENEFVNLTLLDELSKDLEERNRENQSLKGTLAYYDNQKELLNTRHDREKKQFRFKQDAKILMLGGKSGIGKDDISDIFKFLGLPRDAFEVVNYDDLQRFDVSKLPNTTKYSDIFIGCIPHSCKGMGDCDNIISFFNKNQETLPKITEIQSGGGKLSQFSKSNLLYSIIDSDLFHAFRQTG